MEQVSSPDSLLPSYFLETSQGTILAQHIYDSTLSFIENDAALGQTFSLSSALFTFHKKQAEQPEEPEEQRS